MIADRKRWERVFTLRRAIIPHIIMAGTRPPHRGERGPQRYVVLSDDLDDTLYAALETEAALATKRARTRKRGA